VLTGYPPGTPKSPSLDGARVYQFIESFTGDTEEVTGLLDGVDLIGLYFVYRFLTFSPHICYFFIGKESKAVK
ncbi:hypothetical protein LR013_05630, partial [candidate division NPL-UPA2 bacterium]|nr:hypothetical protein [candidate division NPL-UPA2 bacterium]